MKAAGWVVCLLIMGWHAVEKASWVAEDRAHDFEEARLVEAWNAMNRRVIALETTLPPEYSGRKRRFWNWRRKQAQQTVAPPALPPTEGCQGRAAGLWTGGDF